MEKDKKYWFLLGIDKREVIVNDTYDKVHDRVTYKWNSCSPYYETEEELKNEEKVAEYVCSSCGGIVSLHYTNRAELEKDKLCFMCEFWMDKVRIKDQPSVARIKGGHYIVSPDSNAPFKGFGGAEFRIKFNDGREIVTHNLWHQGTIPEHFREQLPDNAVFVG